MKRSRKILIEKYVELRCKKLQEQSLWDTAKNIGSALWSITPGEQLKNQYQNIQNMKSDVENQIKTGQIKSPEDFNFMDTFNRNVTEPSLDQLQTNLDAAGMTPVVGVFADGANILTSWGRAAATDDPEMKDKHMKNAALSGGAAIPGPMGWTGGSAKLYKAGVKMNKDKYKGTDDASQSQFASTPQPFDTAAATQANAYKNQNYSTAQSDSFSGINTNVKNLDSKNLNNPAQNLKNNLANLNKTNLKNNLANKSSILPKLT